MGTNTYPADRQIFDSPPPEAKDKDIFLDTEYITEVDAVSIWQPMYKLIIDNKQQNPFVYRGEIAAWIPVMRNGNFSCERDRI